MPTRRAPSRVVPSRASPALALACLAAMLVSTAGAWGADAQRPRAREAGVVIGTLAPGTHNAITDVAGVRVGHATLRSADGLNTGVTAILPHAGNAFLERVPAAIVVGNGYGKLLGLSQVDELGELETPILLTGTLGVWKAADALVDWLLEQPGMDKVRSINPVVGETNDGLLNDIRRRAIGPAQVRAALASATGGAVDEGSVGAGTGTVAFGWKGGIGTSSRMLPGTEGAPTVGVLVQSNYGGRLTVDGVPVWRDLPDPAGLAARNTGDGSIMIVVATDAPLSARQLRRLGTRALLGLARTGSNMSHGSGDYVIAFSTAPSVRRQPGQPRQASGVLADDALTPLFEAVADATEEAILNSLFRATAVEGHRGTVPTLPVDEVLKSLRQRSTPR